MIKAVRGAISVEKNDILSMEKAVLELVSQLVEVNGIGKNHIISIIFSQTNDLNKANPASALRSSGSYEDVPLFCTQEPLYENSMPLILRILLTFESSSKNGIKAIYLGNASSLRIDL